MNLSPTSPICIKPIKAKVKTRLVSAERYLQLEWDVVIWANLQSNQSSLLQSVPRPVFNWLLAGAIWHLNAPLPVRSKPIWPIIKSNWLRVQKWVLNIYSGPNFHHLFKATRCKVIHYYSTDDQIVCETSMFPNAGDYIPTLFINGRKVGDNWGKSCLTCRIRAFDHFSPSIKESVFLFIVYVGGDIEPVHKLLNRLLVAWSGQVSSQFEVNSLWMS